MTKKHKGNWWRMFCLISALIGLLSVVSALADTEMSSISLRYLPRIGALSIRSGQFTAGYLEIYNIPHQLLREKRLEITAWRAQNSSYGNEVFYPEYTVISLDDYSLRSSRRKLVKHAGLVVKPFIFNPLETDTLVRFVLRFTHSSNETEFISVPPSPHCTFKSFCSQIMVYAVKDPSWEDSRAYFNKDKAAKYGKRSYQLADLLNISFTLAKQNLSILPSEILRSDFSSGYQFRHLMNNIGTLPDARFLQLGLGTSQSLLCAMLYGNDINAVTIDDWNSSNTSKLEKLQLDIDLFRGVSSVDLINMNHFDALESTSIRERIIQSLGGKVNIYIFSERHETLDNFLALCNAIDLMEDVFILIVEHWDLGTRKSGVLAAIEALNLDVIYQLDMTTARYNSEQFTLWGNGFATFVIGINH